MAEKMVYMPESVWKEILDSMRAKEGTSAGILATELSEKIAGITTGITPSGTKNITSNGTHDVTDYATANVNVPVPDGYVKPSGTKNITANGTGIDVASYAAVNVSVPVPSGYVKPEYTNEGGVNYINPGNSFFLSAGTYVSNTLQVVANDVTGYEATSISVEAAIAIFEETEYTVLPVYDLADEIISKHSGKLPSFAFITQKEDDFDYGSGGICYLEFISWTGESITPVVTIGQNDVGQAYYYNSSDSSFITVEILSDGFNILSSGGSSEQKNFIGNYFITLFYELS